MITRLIKHGNRYHAIVLDHEGKIHHRRFISKDNAIAYIEDYYQYHKRIVSYEV